MDKFSYGLGMNIGQNLASMGVSTLEFADFVKGMQDVLSGKQTEITVVEAQNAINDFFNKLTEEKYGKTKESGIAFLEENKKREGVVTLPSGLQYEIINAGLGKKPTAADRVQCHYEGTLIDGTVFDSSIKRGQPAVFGVSQVIAGWVEALQLMGEGSKWRLYIPYDLAYGANGAGEMIPPYSALIFDVELIKVL
ncbi:MAG: FKBP-type peptidyl-prolyl cis-trans isomerase [Bacteroidaceae bacterium]|jgi:FKBP-type peptidyl-prolyl cis-trans isomerase FklB|nr:FKBP-type peptidyl-prolyl cis-trans isomerase [Bacteroidales bacterium]MBQ3152316.1 FKBP-type peptidyl-prolyl cis-trans isomerase [Bacteroidaceae bacterium]MBR4293807.1 FKBP-type peptidyl-prolyl cis-trans isomerase [Bacteroidaceae bacterium]MBR6806615.1 FKBP-type peptidyl-prolyl cis-trans isomerase [Bacteroidaceae bacterium]